MRGVSWKNKLHAYIDPSLVKGIYIISIKDKFLKIKSCSFNNWHTYIDNDKCLQLIGLYVKIT